MVAELADADLWCTHASTVSRVRQQAKVCPGALEPRDNHRNTHAFWSTDRQSNNRLMFTMPEIV